MPNIPEVVAIVVFVLLAGLWAWRVKRNVAQTDEWRDLYAQNLALSREAMTQQGEAIKAMRELTEALRARR